MIWQLLFSITMLVLVVLLEPAGKPRPVPTTTCSYNFNIEQTANTPFAELYPALGKMKAIGKGAADDEH